MIEFYKKYLNKRKRFPNLTDHTKKFGSTYMCEQLFSKMKNIKSKIRLKLPDSHLDSLLILACSNTQGNIEVFLPEATTVFLTNICLH